MWHSLSYVYDSLFMVREIFSYEGKLISEIIINLQKTEKKEGDSVFLVRGILVFENSPKETVIL